LLLARPGVLTPAKKPHNTSIKIEKRVSEARCARKSGIRQVELQKSGRKHANGNKVDHGAGVGGE